MKINAQSQAEPFFHPNNLKANDQEVPLAIGAITTDLNSSSLPNTLVTLNKEKKTITEEPRTPHSRAKNLTRFYPVTKDAPIIKPDVRLSLT